MSRTNSLTLVSEYLGEHFWTICNWKSLLGCSDGKGIISSDEFTVFMKDEAGKSFCSVWKIIAFPKQTSVTRKNMLAFRLVNLSREEAVLKGSFYFKTICPDGMFGPMTVTKFKRIPLDAAEKWITCVCYHPHDDLTLKIKIKLVVTATKSETLLLPHKGRSFFYKLKEIMLGPKEKATVYLPRLQHHAM